MSAASNSVVVGVCDAVLTVPGIIWLADSASLAAAVAELFIALMSADMFSDEFSVGSPPSVPDAVDGRLSVFVLIAVMLALSGFIVAKPVAVVQLPAPCATDRSVPTCVLMVVAVGGVVYDDASITAPADMLSRYPALADVNRVLIMLYASPVCGVLLVYVVSVSTNVTCATVSVVGLK